MKRYAVVVAEGVRDDLVGIERWHRRVDRVIDRTVEITAGIAQTEPSGKAELIVSKAVAGTHSDKLAERVLRADGELFGNVGKRLEVEANKPVMDHRTVRIRGRSNVKETLEEVDAKTGTE
jgi:hypothetical protein